MFIIQRDCHKRDYKEFLFLNHVCDLLHLDLNHQVVTGLLGLANCAFGCYAAFKEVNIQVFLQLKACGIAVFINWGENVFLSSGRYCLVVVLYLSESWNALDQRRQSTVCPSYAKVPSSSELFAISVFLQFLSFPFNHVTISLQSHCFLFDNLRLCALFFINCTI